MEIRTSTTQRRVRFEADSQECIRRLRRDGFKHVPQHLRECLGLAEEQGRTMLYALLLVAADLIEGKRA